MPLSHVSYWHGALWRRWESRSQDKHTMCTESSADAHACNSGQQRVGELLGHEQPDTHINPLRKAQEQPTKEVESSLDGATLLTKDYNERLTLRKNIRLER